jgi:hypothetical protein
VAFGQRAPVPGGIPAYLDKFAAQAGVVRRGPGQPLKSWVYLLGVRDPDDSGVQSLVRRLADLPDLMRASFSVKAPSLLHQPGDQVVVVGLGNSGAHAEYLVRTLVREGIFAVRLNPGDPDLRDSRFAKDRTLVFISQGLSPNAAGSVAPDVVGRYRQVVVLTAATQANTASNPKKAPLVADLVARENVTFFTMPPACVNEYDTFLRLTGPRAGFLMVDTLARAFVQAEGRAVEPGASIDDVLKACQAAENWAATHGMRFEVTDPQKVPLRIICLDRRIVTENVKLKWMEGLFTEAPTVSDGPTHAHGPAQHQWPFPNKYILVYRPTDEWECRVRDAMLNTYHGTDQEVFPFPVRLPGPQATLELEELFDRVVVSLIARYGVPQTTWPGREIDDRPEGLYNLTF